MDTLIKFIAVVGVIVLAGVLFAYPTKWLINDLFTSGTITSLFGVKSIGFWKAVELDILCAILFQSSSSSKD